MLTIMTLCFVTTPLSAQTIWSGTADVSWYDANQTSFDISTPEQLAGVAQLVNNHTTTFSGQTINLTTDIWLNADQDSTNNWIPIGGDASATQEASNALDSYSFKGHFNGHGHSIYNMYCEKIGYFQAGLFGCIKNPCVIDSVVLINPVVKARGMAAALVGYTQSGGHLYISECLLVNVRVDCSLGATGNNNGGLIGGNWQLEHTSYWTYVSNCGVTGLIHGKYIGGIAGNGQKINATNCYFAGTLIPELEDGLNRYGAIVGHCDNGKISINNCYSNMASPTTYSSGRDGIIMNDADMFTSDFVDSLGTAFMMDNGINNGYPIMSYMCGISPNSAGICMGESVTLTAFGYDSYQWNTGATSASITVSPATTTTYTVVGNSASGASGSHSATVTVFPQAVITAAVMPSADGQVHATVNPATTTIACGSSDNVTLSVYPDPDYRVNRVLVNNVEVYGDDFGESSPTTFSINPNGTLADVKIFLSNTYTITATLMMDDGTPLNNSSLVQPFGSNGVYTATSGDSVHYSFNETARYHVSDIAIDDNSYGIITSYDFESVHEDHTIVATYTDACGIQSLPYFDSFESASTSQVPECYAKLSGSSYPYASSSNTHSGSRSIYAYLYTSDYYYFILPRVIDTISYPMNSLMLTFWARSSSTTNTFTVGVMTDPENQNTFTALQTFTPANTNTYEQFIAYFNNVDMTEIYGSYIAIKINPNTNYSSVYIDDIGVDIAPTCSPVRDLELTSVYGTNASITWSPNIVGGVSEYNIYVYDVANDYADEYQTTETSFMISGLSENTAYRVGVYVSCELGDFSDTTFIDVMTPCNSPVALTVGSGTSSSHGNYLPTNTYYNYSLAQQIIPAESLQNATHDFNGMAFQYFNGTSSTRNISIYLAHVSDTSLAAGWILPSTDIEFTEVYSGNIVWDNSGVDYWNQIAFNTVFSYNGSDDILVTVVDNTGAWTNSQEKFYTHSDSTTTNMARYVSRDGSAYDYTNPGVSGTASSNVNNIQFIYCDASNCIRPNSLAASNVDESSAEISWVSAGSESTWDVDYKLASDTAWTNYGTVSTNSVTLTNLANNAFYQVRVRSVCGIGDYSLWSIPVAFRTSCPSISVTSAPWTEDFENSTDDPDCWISASTSYYNGHTFPYVQPASSIAHGGSKALEIAFGNIVTALPQFDESLSDLLLTFWAYNNQYSSSYSNILEVGYITDPNNASTFVPTDTITFTTYTKMVKSFTDLADLNLPATTRIAFRFNQQSSSNLTSWYLDDFTVEILPTCMQPYGLTASEIGETEVTLSWTELGNATGWNIEYGSVGFTPGMGTGTSVYADENPFLVNGLTSATAYDFYVQADCGSTWEGPLTVVTGQHIMNTTGSDTLTTCGMVIYDNGGPDGQYDYNCDAVLVIYPADPDSKLSLTGTANIENNWDFLYIYDGVGTDGTPITTISGDNQTVNVISNSGPLTLHFTSDGSVVKSGFELLAQCVSCYPPANFRVSDISTTGATISWSGNANEYGVYVMLTDTVYYTTTDTFLTLSGLTQSSTYSVMARSLCGGDSSALSQSFSFNTSCGLFPITEADPWFENFESYGTGSGAHSVPVDICWATPETLQVNNGVSPFVYCGWSGSTYSGSNSLEMKGSPTMVVFPEFSNDINTLRISMWGNTTASDASGAGTMALGYISDISDASTFVAIDTIPATAFERTGTDAAHANFIGPYDFSGVTPQPGLRIALRLTGIATPASLSPTSWNLDDITISLIPSCLSPVKTSLAISDVDGHSATVTFTDDDPSHDSWTVYYKASTSTDWESDVVTTIPYILTGLIPETDYEVYVVTNCGGIPSTDATLHRSFTTLVACPAPTNVTVDNIGTSTATVTWNGTADSYLVVCGTDTYVATGNTYTITDLAPATSYTVSVTADCGADGTSSAVTASFMTLCETVVNFPYLEGFENGLGCWSSVDGTSSSYNWLTTSSSSNIPAAPEGTQYALAKTTGYTSYTVRLLSPVFDLTSVTNPYVSFAHVQKVWGTDQDELAVYYRTSPSDAWTMLVEYTNDIPAWVYDSLALPSPSATYQISFVATHDYGYGVGVDHVVIFDNDGAGPVVTCTTPTNLAVSAITENSAVAAWTAGNDEAAWNLQFKTLSSSDWGAVISCTQPTYTFNNLGANTQYQVRVQADCGSTVSAWSAVVSFTTNGGSSEVTVPTVTTNPVSGVGQTTATCGGNVTADGNATVTARGVCWSTSHNPTVSDGHTTDGTGVGTFSSSITNLTPNTTYYVRAYATNSAGTAYGNEQTFTTQQQDVEPCDVPTDVTATDIQTESITVHWENAPVVNWKIQYGPLGGTLSSATATTNTYVISNLTPGTTYQIQVQAVCDGGSESEWSEPITPTTLTGINSYLENSVTLYPNPAKEVVNVQCTMNNVQFDVTEVEVYDVFGKIVRTVQWADGHSPMQINVSDLADGMYFVRVTTDQGVVTKRFVKK